MSAAPVFKGLLLLIAGAGAGFLTCWYAKAEPARSAGERLESEIRALQGERDAERERARASGAANELLRSDATAAADARETLQGELETLRQTETQLRAELSGCVELVRTRDEALAEARLELAEADQRGARMASELAELERSLQEEAVERAPIRLAPIESGWHGSPSALAKRAQSAEVREALAPLLARGVHQPSREPTRAPMPFSLRAIEDSGALDRENPESLYHLWSLVVARENDRADKWPTSWAPADTPGWLENWFEVHGDDAIPALDRAQRFLLELGPTLVELRMLAP